MNRSAFLVAPQLQASLKTELAAAATQPALWPYLPESPAQLLPSFARYQARLNHLPRRVRRSLQRRWQRSLSALALLLALGQAPPALAATISVDGINCTLINAITAANTDTATGGCPAGSGADVLHLVANSIHTLTQVNNVTYGNAGLPVVTTNITIEGHGSTISKGPGIPKLSIFVVAHFGNLSLNETIVHDSGDHGIDNFGGKVTVKRSLFSGSSIRNDGYCPYFCESYNGQMTIIDSTITGNDSIGVFNHNGNLTMINSTVSKNEGGGVFNMYDASATLKNCTVSGNNKFGVESFYYSGMKLTNSTVSGNNGTGAGNIGPGFMYLTNSTVSGNASHGVINQASLYMSRTVISGNKGMEINNASSFLKADDFNLIGHDGRTSDLSFYGITPGPTDIIATSDGTRPTPLNKILNPVLTLSGGRTKTHNLVKGSPAVDAVTAGCPPPATDQRGVPRPQGAACDIGAVELVLCNGQAATLVGTAGNDLLRGSSQADVIHGLGGNDRISGRGGNDVLCGGSGNDRLDGGSGYDLCNGGSGVDQAANCETLANVP